jgi:hypothetical protein
MLEFNSDAVSNLPVQVGTKNLLRLCQS